MVSFKDQVILITGASRGIGAAAALQFAAAGATGIAINYRSNVEAASAIAADVERFGSRSLTIAADVSRSDEARSLVDQTLKHFGRLDVVVANAGVWPAEERAVFDIGDQQWDRTLRTNLSGVFYVCRRAAQVFVDSRRGNIVTVSSTAAQRGEALHSDYAASKGAIVSFTKSLASELGVYNVRVNCVAPGWVDTEMSASALRTDEQSLKRITDAIPLRRVASAEDIAAPIVFLASDMARHITGEVLNVNGGSVLCG
ncbi:MAG: SDR family NAD(P)-dependent oxidoreductase [Acidobacteriota bacterium]